VEARTYNSQDQDRPGSNDMGEGGVRGGDGCIELLVSGDDRRRRTLDDDRSRSRDRCCRPNCFHQSDGEHPEEKKMAERPQQLHWCVEKTTPASLVCWTDHTNCIGVTEEALPRPWDRTPILRRGREEKKGPTLLHCHGPFSLSALHHDLLSCCVLM
jgi:hypothetical protein